MSDDRAHDASGLASSQPAGAAPQEGQPTSSDKGKLHVFISYSRDDLKFADQLDAALNAYGLECLIDRHGISGGEDWKRRLGNLIRQTTSAYWPVNDNAALAFSENVYRQVLRGETLGGAMMAGCKAGEDFPSAD